MQPGSISDLWNSHGVDPAALAGLGLRAIDQIAELQRRLAADLERRHEQLGAIFEITRTTALLTSPEAIRQNVLDCYVQMFRGARVLLWDGAVARRLFDDASRPLAIDDLALVAALAPTGRLDSNAAVAAVEPVDGHILVGRLISLDRPEGHDLLITIRPASEAPYDQPDRLLSETVLAYGGHVLGHALMVQRETAAALETVLALANAIDARDAYTRGHSERVAWLAVQIGLAAGMSDVFLQQTEWAGLLHDVGKIGVPEAVLKKTERLTDEEFALIKEHARTGYEVLRPVRRLQGVAEAVLYHHENWDGSGYPYALAGEQIPWVARALRIADTFDAMTSARSYRAQATVAEALAELQRVAGQATDPDLTRLFVQRLTELLAEPTPDFRRRFGHAFPRDSHHPPAAAVPA